MSAVTDQGLKDFADLGLRSQVAAAAANGSALHLVGLVGKDGVQEAVADLGLPKNGAVDRAYVDGGLACHVPPEILQRTAVQVFASMLRHAADRPGEAIWTRARIVNGRLDVEVDIPRMKLRGSRKEAA